MSADQLRRAADAIEQSEPVLRVVRADGGLAEPDAAVALLLRAAAREVGRREGGLEHEPSAANCQVTWQVLPDKYESLECLRCRFDDVAAAYLGEEPQP